MKSQSNQILELLKDGAWHCVNEMLALYCVDYRRRLVDLKEKGYQLESRMCTQHTHRGGSKEWRLIEAQKSVQTFRVLNDQGVVYRDLTI